MLVLVMNRVIFHFSGAPKSCLQGPEEAREFWFEEYKELLP